MEKLPFRTFQNNTVSELFRYSFVTLLSPLVLYPQNDTHYLINRKTFGIILFRNVSERYSFGNFSLPLHCTPKMALAFS